MINEISLAAVQQSRHGAGARKPLYDSYCFANIPGTVAKLLGVPHSQSLPESCWKGLGEKFDKIVFFFVDAFGWRFIEKACDQIPFFREMAEQGVLSKLTSQFPSTTAVHVTTAHTALPVGLHGVYEWNYYEPLLDRMIMPLPFSECGAKARSTLLKDGVVASEILPRSAFYTHLVGAGMRPVLFQHEDYAFEPYNKVVCDGAEIVAYDSYSLGLQELARRVSVDPGPAYYFFYFDGVDSAAHWYGPNSPECFEQQKKFFGALEMDFMKKCQASKESTLFLLSADHGVAEMDYNTTMYVDKEVAAILPLIQCGRNNQPMVPAGSSRDFFLHIRTGSEDEAVAMLGKYFGTRAEVLLVKDLIDGGYFGDPRSLSSAFLGRVGNVVVLPGEGQSVFWFGDGRFAKKFVGNHGGLSAREMEIPFLAWAP